MPTLSIQNDKFSKILYKPLLKCSNKLFDEFAKEIETLLQSYANTITPFLTTIDDNDYNIEKINISVEHSKQFRNIMTVYVDFCDSAVEDPNVIKRYKVVINVNDYNIKIDRNEFDIYGYDDESINEHFLDIVKHCSSKTIYDSISINLEKIEDLNDDVVINTNVFPSNCGSVDITEPDEIIEQVKLYEKLKDVTVSNIPAPHYLFDNWTINGKIVATSPEYTFTAKEHTTIVANFKKEKYTVQVSEKNNRNRYAILLGAGTYEYGECVEVVAKALPGYAFVQWENDKGQLVSSNANYSFNIDDNTILYAVFAENNAKSNPTKKSKYDDEEYTETGSN